MYWFFLKRELAAWTRCGYGLSLWWRDDDGRAPSRRLDRLIALAERHHVPLTLAIIPDGQPAALADRLATSPSITVIQHGVDHIDRTAAVGGPKSELLPEWDTDEIARRVGAGWRALRQIRNAIPVFAPPWNASHPSLEEALVLVDFVGISERDESRNRRDYLPRVNIHIELLRWNHGARFRGARRFLRCFTRLCRERRLARAWSEPIGLLTHHLDHDDSSWVFLEEFLKAMNANPAVKWCGLRELISVSRRELAKTGTAGVARSRAGAIKQSA